MNTWRNTTSTSFWSSSKISYKHFSRSAFRNLPSPRIPPGAHSGSPRRVFFFENFLKNFHLGTPVGILLKNQSKIPLKINLGIPAHFSGNPLRIPSAILSGNSPTSSTGFSLKYSSLRLFINVFHRNFAKIFFYYYFTKNSLEIVYDSS